MLLTYCAAAILNPAARVRAGVQLFRLQSLTTEAVGRLRKYGASIWPIARAGLDQPQWGAPARDFSKPPKPSGCGQFFESIAAASGLAFFATLILGRFLGSMT